MNRRRLFLVGGTGLAVAMTGVNLASAQTPSADPVTDATGEDDAVALLERAATAMAALQTFGFEIQTVAGETSIMGLLTINDITGAVSRPLDFTATIEVGSPIGTIDISAIGKDGNAWIQNPLSDGEWITLAEMGGDILTIINPDSLILASIGLIQNATLDGTESVDGQEATRIAGTIDLAGTAESVMGDSNDVPAELATEPLDVMVWIDENDHVLEIELSGPVLASEADDVIRSISFFDFDEPVDIEEPPV